LTVAPRPPTSSLFPYTTLFRSPLTKLAIGVLKERPQIDGRAWVFPGRTGHLTTLKKPWKKFRERAGISDFTFHDLRRTLATQEGDRKSTRLNSSHQIISYAVFC